MAHPAEPSDQPDPTDRPTDRPTDATDRPGAAPRRTGPLAGVRVLDLTAVVLGPVATQILGDYGADVIKVEPPEGDMMRANGVSRVRGLSSIFLAINRNKRSLAIDLKQPAGIAAIKRLLPTVDVLVHNMRTAAIERLGLGYDACAAINPRLLYCVATGFGEAGPDAGKPAFDDVIQAACGLASLLGSEDGQPDYVPSLIADKTTGLALANAVLAALFERSRSGLGQVVEVPMLEPRREEPGARGVRAAGALRRHHCRREAGGQPRLLPADRDSRTRPARREQAD